MWIWQLLKTELVTDNSLYAVWQFVFPEGTKLTRQLLKVDAVVVSGIRTKLNCRSALKGGSLKTEDAGERWQPPSERGLGSFSSGWV